MNNLINRIQTRPGYKYLAVIVSVVGFFMIMSYTQPVVEVDGDDMVVSVDGKPTFRPLMNWDLREAKIVRVN